MNPNSIDYLYQVTSVTDRAPIASRTDESSSGFDDHLSQASSTVFDVIRPTNRTSSASIYTQSNDSSLADQYNSSTAPPASHDDDSTSSSQHSSTDNTRDSTPTAGQPQAQKSHRSRDKDSHDRSKHDKRENNQVASATGSTRTDANDDAAKATQKADTTATEATDSAKAKVEDDSSLPTTPAEPKSDADQSAVVNTKTADSASTLKVVAESEKTVPTSELTTSSEEPPVQNARVSKADKNIAATGKSRIVAPVKDTDLTTANSQKPGQSNPNIATTGNSAALRASAEAQGSADAKQATAEVSDKPPSNLDDSKTRDSEKQPATPTAHVDPTASNNNASTPAVANVVAPTFVDATRDVKAKASDDDAIKSVSSKGETAVGSLGRTLRTDSASSSREADGSDTPQVDPARFVSRVVKAVQTANDRGGPLQLRLSPPELGSLKIQLTLKDGGLSASLEADNSNARKLLLDHLPALRDRLADQNIRVDRFDVDVKHENTGGQANSRGSNQNPYQQQEQGGGTRRPPTSGAPVIEMAAPAPASQVASVSSTGINLVI